MNTDPDPQLLAPTQSLEIGQECPFFSTCRPGNPTDRRTDGLAVTLSRSACICMQSAIKLSMSSPPLGYFRCCLIGYTVIVNAVLFVVFSRRILLCHVCWRRVSRTGPRSSSSLPNLLHQRQERCLCVRDECT